MNKQFLLLLALLLCLVPALGVAGETPTPNDAVALSGLTGAKAIFDVRTKDPGRLLFIVKVIKQTYDSMVAQGVTPRFVISMRGGSLPLLRKDPGYANERDRTMLSEVREIIAAFSTDKARFEACNVAGTIFKVTPEQLAPGITMIGNSLVSLIAYQNRGYAIVPMQ